MILNVPVIPIKDSVDSGQISAFSLRIHGNMSLFYGDTRESLNNRKNFLESLGIDFKDLVCAKQIHASNVRSIKIEDRGSGASSYNNAIADTDALITAQRNLPLAVFTADCLSVFLYDPVTPAIGIVHVGWRSSKENIVAKVLQLMKKQFGSPIDVISMAFGPAIRQCCYEVSFDFKNFFAKDFLMEKNSRLYLDLIKLNKDEAIALGVKESNIFDCQICTSCHNKEFFSYRKEGKTCGRIISVIMLK